MGSGERGMNPIAMTVMYLGKKMAEVLLESCSLPTEPERLGERKRICWLVVLGFNSTLIAKVISWRSVTHMCFLAFSHQYQQKFSFESHRLLFSHTSAQVRGENKPDRE